MKIAMIFRKLNVKGGTQRQGLSLARELKRLGHQITLYTLAYSKEDCYPDLLEGFTVVTPPKDTSAAKSGSEWLRKTGISEVRKENRQARELAALMTPDFDVLNPHDQVAYKVAFYYKKFKKNVPAVWNMNDLPLKRWGYDRAHGCDVNFHQAWYKHVMYHIFDFYDKHAFIKHVDAITVVDFFNRDLVRDYLGLKAHTVRSGPDFEHFEFKAKQPPQNNSIKILTSGILMPHRRFEDSIRALPILEKNGVHATLDIIGDTDNDKKYFARMQALVKELGLEAKVKFLGRVSDADLISAYQNHDVYIFQHHLQSDGLSPFEAAACGMPIIVSKTAGCHEVLTDRENALFIDPKTPEDIAAKVTELVKDPELYKKMQKNANAFVRANFSWPKYAEGNLGVWEKVRKDGSQISL